MDNEAVEESAAQPEGGRRSAWALMGQGLLRPRLAFEGMRERPRWVWPFVIVLVTATLLAIVTMITPAGLETQMQALEANREQMGEAAFQQAREQISSPLFRTVGLLIAVVGSLIGGAAVFFLTAVAYQGFVSLLGGRGSADYRSALAVVGLSSLPGAIRNVLQFGAVLAGGAMPAQGLSGLLPPDQALTPLGALLGRVDLFVVWGLVIAVVGLATAFKVSRTKAWGVVLGWWLLGALFAMALAGLGRLLTSGPM